jgi:serine/threonine protein kinase
MYTRKKRTNIRKKRTNIRKKSTSIRKKSKSIRKKTIKRGGVLTKTFRPDTDMVAPPEYSDPPVSIINPENQFYYERGKEIGKNYYELTLLGKGAYGSVYSTARPYDETKYAVKIVRYASSNTEKRNKIIENTKNEIDILFMLQQHCANYFVCFIEYFSDDKNMYIVCEELIGYVTLSYFIKTNGIESSYNEDYISMLLITIFSNLCKGMKMLHYLGIAHRDVKPGNILVHPSGNIKYIDFGLSCYTSEMISRTCDSLAGSPGYMDPFLQKPLTREALIAADLWSLGMTLCVMIDKYLPMELANVNVDPFNIVKSVQNFYTANATNFLYEPYMRRAMQINALNYNYAIELNKNLPEDEKYCTALLQSLLSPFIFDRVIFTP